MPGRSPGRKADLAFDPWIPRMDDPAARTRHAGGLRGAGSGSPAATLSESGCAYQPRIELKTEKRVECRGRFVTLSH